MEIFNMPVYYKCKACGKEHLSPINFQNKSSFESSELQNNTFKCPNTNMSSSYNKGDLFWKDEFGNLVQRIESGIANVVASGSVFSFFGNPISILELLIFPH